MKILKIKNNNCGFALGHVILFFLAICLANAFGQGNTNQPHIGYLFPAGGQAGTVVQITAGGQFLGGATEVYVTGKGVRATVIRHFRSKANLNGDERRALQSKIEKVWDKRMQEANIENPVSLFFPAQRTEKISDSNNPQLKKIDHPLLYNLENKSIRELINIREMIFFPREKRQRNSQLAESVLIKITIDANAELGNRELRIQTRQGMTNPVVFQIGNLPEINGLETANQKFLLRFPELADIVKEKPLELPVVINSQIMPGDIDRFRFRGRAGQKLVIQTNARNLNPYLADAVPGWFQAVTTLYDSNGKEIAYDDDYRFDPDPVMFYKLAADGEYELEIRDSIYRGREDFVYRIAIGELAFVTQMFPLGGRQGVKTIATIDGWNLTNNRLMLDTAAGESIRKTCCGKGKNQSNVAAYAVDSLPECNETETNNNLEKAQQIELPMIVNGRIGKAGDIDYFRFKGTKGQKIVAEVFARRLNSPIDSLLRLVDESGKVLKWNDDFSEVEENYLYKDMTGVMTHHADSYMTAELAEDGNYCIQLTDAQNHGGKAYAYRLRIGEPKPDFAIRTTPSTLNVRPGSITEFNVYVMRQDGFDGEIDVIGKDLPEGFAVSDGKISAGKNCIKMKLSADKDILAKPVNLELIANAKINGKIISRSVVPCEDMMQAFLYRHLVPSQQLIAAPMKMKFQRRKFNESKL